MHDSPDTTSLELLLEKERTARAAAELALQQKAEELARLRQEILLLKQESTKATAHKKGGDLRAVAEQMMEEPDESHEKIRKLWTTLEKIGDNVWEHNFRTGKTYLSQKEFDLLGYADEKPADPATLWWSLLHKD